MTASTHQSPQSDQRYITVSDYINMAQDCDGLIWLVHGLADVWGIIIAVGTRRGYRSFRAWCKHISSYLQIGGQHFSVGMEEAAKRGCYVDLVSEVKRWPGKIAVFRPRGLTDADRAAIKQIMIRDAGGDYAFCQIFGITVRKSWTVSAIVNLLSFTHFIGGFLRWTKRQSEETAAQHTAAICSQFYDAAFAEHFGRPMFVMEESRFVAPNDIANSTYMEYLGTLVPCEDWQPEPAPDMWGIFFGTLTWMAIGSLVIASLNLLF